LRIDDHHGVIAPVLSAISIQVNSRIGDHHDVLAPVLSAINVYPRAPVR